ncbi:hypothetical protein BaRGS_00013057 [Batillaria attramentaria]|uniref:Uncharacterized protein n=1 Tax=Batillaria attramentaria TaxID=370345 RepID=A0ABD0L8U2_9CAEN
MGWSSLRTMWDSGRLGPGDDLDQGEESTHSDIMFGHTGVRILRSTRPSTWPPAPRANETKGSVWCPDTDTRQNFAISLIPS